MNGSNDVTHVVKAIQPVAPACVPAVARRGLCFGSIINRALTAAEPILSSSIDMGSFRGCSNKKRHLTSLLLMRVVVLSACVAGALSYARSRGPPDRSSLRVQWNVTGETRACARWGVIVCSGALSMYW